MVKSLFWSFLGDKMVTLHICRTHTRAHTLLLLRRPQVNLLVAFIGFFFQNNIWWGEHCGLAAAATLTSHMFG